MQKYSMFKSTLSLGSAIALLLLASIHFPLKEILSHSTLQCTHSPVTGLVRVLTWALTEQGQAIITAVIGGGAIMSYLCSHRMREARELGAAILALLIFVVFGVVKTQVRAEPKACAQEKIVMVRLR